MGIYVLLCVITACAMLRDLIISKFSPRHPVFAETNINRCASFAAILPIVEPSWKRR